MPAEVVPVIAAVVFAFAAFMAALGFAAVWSELGDKPKD
jgi:hypothetical protein